MKRNRIGLITFIFVTVAVILGVLKDFQVLAIPDQLMMTTRWILAAVLVIYALTKKNLTTWYVCC